MEEKIIKILENVCNKTNVDYKNCNLIESGILESLALMQLLASLEEEYKIEIDIDDINEENFSTVKDIVNLIKKSKI